MAGGPFGFIPSEHKISEQEIQFELTTLKEGIDDIISKFKDKNKIDHLKDKNVLYKNLNKVSLIIGEDMKVQNVVDVQKLIKEAKTKLTKEMQKAELSIYKEKFYSKQEIDEVLMPVILYLEEIWTQEEKEIKIIENNVKEFIKRLNEEHKKMINKGRKR